MKRGDDERIERKGEDEEEEEKIEKFFSLIRSFREAHDRRKSELKEMEEKRRKKKRKMEDEQSSWVPTFSPEDFNEEIEFRTPVIFSGRRKDEKNVEDQENDGDVNLKLSLSIV